MPAASPESDPSIVVIFVAVDEQQGGPSVCIQRAGAG